jgi:hypothetical protein
MPSMKSFRDVMASVQHRPAAPGTPTEAPRFLQAIAASTGGSRAPAAPQVITHAMFESAPETPARLQAAARAPMPARHAAPAASPAKATGFGAMLQRVASQNGAQVVSVLDESAPAPTVQAPAAPVAEGFVSDAVGKFMNDMDKAPIHEHNHTHAFKTIAHGQDTINHAAHTINHVINRVSDPTHQGHLANAHKALQEAHAKMQEAIGHINHANTHYTNSLPK